MIQPPEDFFARSPLYAVLFDSSGDVNEPYTPYLIGKKSEDGIFDSDAGGTVPHGLSRDMAQALPGLWYCLHLPNIFAQLGDIPFAAIKDGQGGFLGHHFFFAPVQLFNTTLIRAWPPWSAPTLAVSPDNLFAQVRVNAEALGFPLPAVPYSELSDTLLKEHWRAIHGIFAPDFPYLGREPKLSTSLDLAPTALPVSWLLRQFAEEIPAEATDNTVKLLQIAKTCQATVAEYARLEFEEAASADESTPQIDSQKWRPAGPIVLALPGVAAAYTKKIYSSSVRERIEPLSASDPLDTWSIDLPERSDALVERATIELVTTHRAIAQTGVGLVLPSVPEAAFLALGELERHFATSPNGPGVWRLLERLNQAAKEMWTETLLEAITNVSQLTVFSNFPVGLLTYPGDSSPLSSRLPIAYNPLNPLSRTMQLELTYTPAVNLSHGFSVLVAECIDPDDPVGKASRTGWQAAKEFIARVGYPIEFSTEEIPSVTRLREAISDSEPVILVLSAHGVHRPKANLSGLMIGDQFCLGPELGDMPPVVILSSCQVSPRGIGAVSITDLILRQGALAVLGTLVPIDVIHNAVLLARLFLYLAESIEKREGYRNLLDAWHHVQGSNAVNDVLYGNRGLRNWGLRPGVDGMTVLQRFMETEAAGRIRRSHTYSDTEVVLGEMADKQGVGDKVRNWFRRPGYIPESLFYIFAGQPERVHLRVPGEH